MGENGPGGLVKRNRSELHARLRDSVTCAMIETAISRWASGADVEADRRVDLRNFVRGEPIGTQALDALGMGAGGPKAAEIETVGLQRDADCRVVKFRVMGQGDDGGARVEPMGFHGLVRPIGDNRLAWEPRGGTETVTRINQHGVVARQTGELHQWLGNVDRANHNHAQGRVVNSDEFFALKAGFVGAKTLGMQRRGVDPPRPGGGIGDHGSRLARRAIFGQFGQKIGSMPPAPMGSTITRIVPPQASPTAKALSSETP